MRGGSIWRRKAIVWALPLGFLLLNLSLFFGNRLVLGVRLIALESDLASRETRREALIAERDRKVDLLRRAGAAGEDLRVLYTERLAPKRERLTSVLAHVRELARRAGLEPESITYPETTLAEQGLEKLSFVFSVQGDFRSLRQFVSLLEASDEFLALEQIGVSEASGATASNLQVRLTISTMFTLEPTTEGPAT